MIPCTQDLKFHDVGVEDVMWGFGWGGGGVGGGMITSRRLRSLVMLCLSDYDVSLAVVRVGGWGGGGA